MTSKDSLILSLQGSWEGYNGELIWDIRPDSIFYYSENRSYYYFINNNDMVVLYKNGPYKIKNIRVVNDTFFFKTDGIDAIASRSEKTSSIKFTEDHFNNHLKDETSNDNITNKILGKWGYEHKEGVFSWVFSKDSIFYIQLNKQYFYVQHDSSIIVLTEDDATIMKNMVIKSDTMSFTTEENVLIKAHKIK